MLNFVALLWSLTIESRLPNQLTNFVANHELVNEQNFYCTIDIFFISALIMKMNSLFFIFCAENSISQG